MARELAKNPTVLVVNDIVFVHGGLLPHHLKYGLQRINNEVAEWMSGAEKADGSQAAPPFPAMGDASSVQWNRTFGKERVSDCEPAAGGGCRGLRLLRSGASLTGRYLLSWNCPVAGVSGTAPALLTSPPAALPSLPQTSACT
jgi:hypothetical protein